MIDFKNAALLKLRAVDVENGIKAVQFMLIDGEIVLAAYKAVRDMVIFTNKRVVAINIQGVTGMRKDYTSLPYKKVQSFSIETAGMADIDGELQLWFSGLGLVRFEFLGSSALRSIARVIGEYIL